MSLESKSWLMTALLGFLLWKSNKPQLDLIFFIDQVIWWTCWLEGSFEGFTMKRHLKGSETKG